MGARRKMIVATQLDPATLIAILLLLLNLGRN